MNEFLKRHADEIIRRINRKSGIQYPVSSIKYQQLKPTPAGKCR